MKLSAFFKYYMLIVLFVWSVMIPSNTASAKESISNIDSITSTELLVKYIDLPQSLGDLRPLPALGASIEDVTESVDLLTFSGEQEAQEAAKELEDSPFIQTVEQNHKRGVLQTTDTFYTSQWWLRDIKAEVLWPMKSEQQRPVTVAVIDSGIDLRHEDLLGRIMNNGYNFITQNQNVADDLGHGTQVAGIIASSANNGIGIAGVAGNFQVSILPLKTAGADGVSTVAHNIQAIDYAIKQKVDVINISLGGETQSAIEHDAILRAVRAGIPIVAAAGNEALKGNTVMYPAAYEEVISVGAVDQNHKRAAFSNYHPSVDLVAPGQEIATTSPQNRYALVSGTSFSVPVVAGTAAMLKAVLPDLSAQQTKDILLSSTTDLGRPGRDAEYGEGLLDISKVKAKIESMQKKHQPIPVTKILLNETTIQLRLGTKNERVQLKATVLPADATNREVIWETSDPSVAVVTQQGEVSAKGEGNANITVYTADRKHSASATVTVSKEQQFVGSFPDVLLGNDQIFEVKFNQKLAADQDFQPYIRISRKADGQELITTFKVQLHPSSPDKLLITPTETWEPGVYYLTIQKGIATKAKKTLKEDVLVRFIVE